MAIVYRCDGCSCDLPAHASSAECPDGCRGCTNGHEGDVVGRLDPAHYCPTCASTWRAHDAAVRAERVTAIRAMEAFIRDTETELKKTLRRVPD